MIAKVGNQSETTPLMNVEGAVEKAATKIYWWKDSFFKYLWNPYVITLAYHNIQ